MKAREKLDNEAAIAATKADRQWNSTLGLQTRANYRSGFRDGYRDAAKPREELIAELVTALKEANEALHRSDVMDLALDPIYRTRILKAIAKAEARS